MKEYTVDRIRNICLLSHGGAGKTTLAEAMLYNTGILDRFGKVSDGTSTMDYDPEEIKRQISISTSVATCEWHDCKVNIIDTPGYFDFVGEVMEGIRAAETAVILVQAKAGVAVGTEKSWQYAEERNMARMFFVSKLDEEHADFNKVLEQLKEFFGNKVIPFEIPIIENGQIKGCIDVLTKTARAWTPGKSMEIPMPAGYEDVLEPIHESILEAIAETSEELMEKYFAGEEFTKEEKLAGICAGISDGSIVPVFFGIALNNIGITDFMDKIVELAPAPNKVGAVKGVKPGTDTEIEYKVDAGEKLSALVFKTIADPFVGKISIFRVFSGTMKADSVVYNSTSEKQEKIGQLFQLRGKKQLPVDKLIAGDIGATAKLQFTSTNDTLCDVSAPIELPKIVFPEPAISLAVEPKAKGDEEKISAGLQRLQEEDPTFKTTVNTETKQTLISGVGEQHLDIIVSKLKSKFNVSVTLTDPKVPYRETIRKKVKVEGKHKKQSGGHGQYGHVWIEFEPGESEDLVFEEKIFGGAVPKQYFPAVEKGLREAIAHGVLAGYPVVNLKATLVDGSYHPVDSSEMAFKIAAKLAYKKGLEQANPVLLEPIVHVEVVVPDKYMGDIVGDLNKRRGRILGMNPAGAGSQQIVAEVPQSEMVRYATDLRSMTQGRGSFKLWFERYEEAPANISQKVIEESGKSTFDEDLE